MWPVASHHDSSTMMKSEDGPRVALQSMFGVSDTATAVCQAWMQASSRMGATLVQLMPGERLRPETVRRLRLDTMEGFPHYFRLDGHPAAKGKGAKKPPRAPQLMSNTKAKRAGLWLKADELT